MIVLHKTNVLDVRESNDLSNKCVQTHESRLIWISDARAIFEFYEYSLFMKTSLDTKNKHEIVALCLHRFSAILESLEVGNPNRLKFININKKKYIDYLCN